MKKWIVLFCSIILVIIIMTLVAKNLNKDEVNYTKITFEQYQEKINNKDTFYIYFYENGCAGCQNFSPSLNQLIKEKKLTVCGVEVSQYKSRFKDYIIDKNIKQVPTLIFYDKGVESNRIGGGDTSKSQMEQFFMKTNESILK